MTDGQEILKHIQLLQRQQDRFESHFTSEMGNYTRQIDEMNKCVTEMQREVINLRLWKSNMQGRMFVTGFFSGIMAGIIVGVTIWFITKN